jgi:hypothetical protein
VQPKPKAEVVKAAAVEPEEVKPAKKAKKVKAEKVAKAVEPKAVKPPKPTAAEKKALKLQAKAEKKALKDAKIAAAKEAKAAKKAAKAEAKAAKKVEAKEPKEPKAATEKKTPASGQSGAKIEGLGTEECALNDKEAELLVKGFGTTGHRTEQTIETLATAVWPNKKAKQANSWVRNSMRRLVRGGLVSKENRGHYLQTEEGRAVAKKQKIK